MKHIKMKKITIYFILTLMLILAVGYFLLGVGSAGDSGVVSDDSNGQIQKVTLSMKNYNYYPNTITVKVNQPVSIVLDKSVVGCYRSFTIKSLGVAKYSKTPDSTVDFTQLKKAHLALLVQWGWEQEH